MKNDAIKITIEDGEKTNVLLTAERLIKKLAEMNFEADVEVVSLIGQFFKGCGISNNRLAYIWEQNQKK